MRVGVVSNCYRVTPPNGIIGFHRAENAHREQRQRSCGIRSSRERKEKGNHSLDTWKRMEKRAHHFRTLRTLVVVVRVAVVSQCAVLHVDYFDIAGQLGEGSVQGGRLRCD